jgi:hypothetical protein
MITQGFRMVTGFIEDLELVNRNTYNALANIHTQQITIAYAVSVCNSLLWSLLGDSSQQWRLFCSLFYIVTGSLRSLNYLSQLSSLI